MEFSTMTVEEIITWLYEKMCNHEKITIDMLKEIVSKCSVTDTIASEGQLPFFIAAVKMRLPVKISGNENKDINKYNKV